VLLNHGSHRKPAFDPPSACLAKSGPQGVIGQQVTDGFCQARHIFGGNQPAGFAMSYHL
jgi:hypothetical protein